MMVPIVSNMSMKKQMKISGISSSRWRNTEAISALKTSGIGLAGSPTIPLNGIFPQKNAISAETRIPIRTPPLTLK